ncbi:hypothetical protein K7X08_008279 [Anisodus acutangulus]|uniref:Uncharacterized protein n=1 Tax=Anisodus acutangulus TaxID=402998 RepID=A0A9Q1RPT4_9SOLA|nr:hypothetical protein K7X08_008279 [Anisodus acutangulus]
MESKPASGHVSSHKDHSSMKHTVIESCGIEEIDNGEYWPLSGKPYVDMILPKTSVKPLYNLYMPKKMTSVLPSAGAPAVLTCGRKKWKMFYGGAKSNHKFNEWRKFVDDNNLKEGMDLCLNFQSAALANSISEFRFSESPPSQKASHVLDPDLRNHWSTGTNTKEWILLELDEPCLLSHIRIYNKSLLEWEISAGLRYKPETFPKVRPHCEAPRRDMMYPMNYTPCRYGRISYLRGSPIAIFYIQQQFI